jgi:hypothetical protein
VARSAQFGLVWLVFTALWASGAGVQAQTILPHSADRELTYYDLSGFGAHALGETGALRLARNEIFARHGYRFENAEIRAYFEDLDWYEAEGQAVELSQTELRNVAFIGRIEAQASDPDLAFHLIGRSPANWTATEIASDGRVRHVQGGAHGMRAYRADDNGAEALYRPHEAHVYEREAGNTQFAVVEPTVRRPRYLDPEHLLYLNVRVVARSAGQWNGEAVQRMQLASDRSHAPAALQGEIDVTADGIVVRAQLTGRYAPEGGEDWQDWSFGYELTDLKRDVAVDPAAFLWPETVETVVAPG